MGETMTFQMFFTHTYVPGRPKTLSAAELALTSRASAHPDVDSQKRPE